MPVDAAAVLSNSANAATILQTAVKLGSKIARYIASAPKESDLVIACRNLDTALEFLTDVINLGPDMDQSDASEMLKLATRWQKLSGKCERMCEGGIQAPKSTLKRWIQYIAGSNNKPAVNFESRWAMVREETETLQESAKAFSNRRKQMAVVTFSRQKGAVIIDDDSRSTRSIVSAWSHVSHADIDDVVYSTPLENNANACLPTMSATMAIITDTTLEHDIVLYHNIWD